MFDAKLAHITVYRRSRLRLICKTLWDELRYYETVSGTTTVVLIQLLNMGSFTPISMSICFSRSKSWE